MYTHTHDIYSRKQTQTNVDIKSTASQALTTTGYCSVNCNVHVACTYVPGDVGRQSRKRRYLLYVVDYDDDIVRRTDVTWMQQSMNFTCSSDCSSSSGSSNNASKLLSCGWLRINNLNAN